MFKRCKIIDPAQPSTSREASQPEINWKSCALCQEETGEKLECPAKSTRKDAGVGYQTVADNIVQFNDLQCLPIPLNLEALDEGGGIKATFLKHSASWHKACKDMFNNTKLSRAQKRKSSDALPSPVKPMATRSKLCTEIEGKEKFCFFCDKPESANQKLRMASTMDVTAHVRNAALELKDTKLLAKLAMPDMIALEASYHLQCLSDLYNRQRALKSKADEGNKAEQYAHGVVLAKLVTYIEETRLDESVWPVFKLSDLTKLYVAQMNEQGFKVDGRIHSTRLKNRILTHIPDLQSVSEGRDVLLVFNKDVGQVIRQASELNYDIFATHLAKAAQIVRKDMLKPQKQFSGSFDAKCQDEAVPYALKTLINMILEGPSIKNDTGNFNDQAALTLSQLMIYNSVKHARAANQEHATRHSRDRETPLVLSIGLTLHAETRSRTLIEMMHRLGISLSYDRILQISAAIGNGVCAIYEQEGVVCPPQLRNNLFTTAAVDNIDVNPSSTTARNSFHGTGISLFQHPTKENPGNRRQVVVIDDNACSAKKVESLPSSYTDIHPLSMSHGNLNVPPVVEPLKLPGLKTFDKELKVENRWLENAGNQASNDSDENIGNFTWAAFHSNKDLAASIPHTSINALLPLLHENAHSPAMIHHTMGLVKAAVQKLNTDQVPIITFDQPSYAMAKEIQWTWPNTHGEKNYLIMFGGLHIEMAAMKALGNWLDGSGWSKLLAEANVASTGTADSFLRGIHVAKTRRAHLVTAVSLAVLKQRAFDEYTQNLESDEEKMDFESWHAYRINQSPQFDYWCKTLSFELTVFLFVRSLREGNFQLYVESLVALVPWFFALDHTNYSRWIPVHIRDMISLPTVHPEIFAQFMMGNFVVQKTQNAFSSMAIDQAHEQNNAKVKGSGGAIGLTENPFALRRWMVAGPEVARVVEEFQASCSKQKVTSQETRHHEQMPFEQKAFKKDVSSLVEAFENFGNPFMDNSNDLLAMDTKEIVNEDGRLSAKNAFEIGKKQFEDFFTERLADPVKAVKDPISRNKLSVFSNPTKVSSKEKTKVSTLKSDRTLFSRLYISCQTRDGNLDEFFKHENHAAPPAISDEGQIRTGTKSDLLVCIIQSNAETTEKPIVEAKILDGAAVVHLLQPGQAKTFKEYGDVFLKHTEMQLQDCGRLDIVWDSYHCDSLKAGLRAKRGKGIRQRVVASSPLPKNWNNFLRVDENKTELFAFLSDHVLKYYHGNKIVYATVGDNVKCTAPGEKVCNISPCTQEEADTRVILHVKDAVEHGFTKVLIRTVDTDVVVLATAYFTRLQASELWLALGSGKHFKYVAIHEIVQNIEPARVLALPVFHAFTGCDQVSSFYGRSKKTAWDVWNCFPEVTQAFTALGNHPDEVSDDEFAVLQRYVVLLYDRTSEIVTVNEARMNLFIRKSRQIESIPPTEAALLQHTKRAAFQGGHIWGNALLNKPAPPSPGDWGWKKNGNVWEPLWTNLPEAAKACHELIHCGCKRSCSTQRCKCNKAALMCTALCTCSGECTNRE